MEESSPDPDKMFSPVTNGITKAKVLVEERDLAQMFFSYKHSHWLTHDNIKNDSDLLEGN